MVKTVCVYCSSSDSVDKKYFELARVLGKEIAARGFRLIYGGAGIGLMGEVAKAVKENGGQVKGVIPKYLHQKGIAYEGLDQLVVTETMANRKEIMGQEADGFITLPGGFGTLEEVMEMITLRQLGYHRKPLVIVNIMGFYDSLLAFFDRMVSDKFMKREFRSIFRVTNSGEEAVEILFKKDPFSMPEKWF